MLPEHGIADVAGATTAYDAVAPLLRPRVDDVHAGRHLALVEVHGSRLAVAELLPQRGAESGKCGLG